MNKPDKYGIKALQPGQSKTVPGVSPYQIGAVVNHYRTKHGMNLVCRANGKDTFIHRIS